jgi:RNA polymerase-binding protein DksA
LEVELYQLFFVGGAKPEAPKLTDPIPAGAQEHLLLSKRQEICTNRSLVDLLASAGELQGDPADMATYETNATTHIRLYQTGGKLLRAIEDALTRIQHEEFSICEECGQPISRARLEAVPWT